MRVLLDTHAWIWMMLAPERFSRVAAAALDRPEVVPCVSPATLYETLLLIERGRIVTDEPREGAAWVRAGLARTQPAVLDITAEIAVVARKLDGYDNPDPFDRFILATARVHRIALVTADRSMQEWGGVRIVW